MSNPVEFYPFQEEALAALNYEFNSAELAVSALLAMAPRSGKTEVVIRQWEEYRETLEQPRGLYLCDTSLIPQQARQRFEERLGESLTTTNNPRDDKSEFTFTTFQKMRGDIADGHVPADKYDYIIVDECHHTPADTYASVVEYLKPKRLIGLSGTVRRLDGRDPADIFGENTYEFGIGEMIASGYTKQIDYRVRLDDELRKEMQKARNEDGPDLNEAARAIHPNLKEIVKDVKAEVATIEDPKVIFYAQDIDHAELIKEYYPGAAETVHSGKADAANRDTITAFNEAELEAIISVDMLNEGIDLPDANVIAFLRSTASERIFLQQLARGLQQSELHDKLLVLDYVANEERLELIANLLNNISAHELTPTAEPKKAEADSSQESTLRLLSRPRGNANFSIQDSIKSLFESANERLVIKERQAHINKLHKEKPELMQKMGIIRLVRTFGPFVRSSRSTQAQVYPNMLGHINFNKAELGRLKKFMRDQWSLGWGANPRHLLNNHQSMVERIEEEFPRESSIIIEGKPLLRQHHELFRVDNKNAGDKFVYIEPRDALSAVAQDITLRLPEDLITIDESDDFRVGASIFSERLGKQFTWIVNPLTDDITVRITENDDTKTYQYNAQPRSTQVAYRLLETRKVIKKYGRIVGYDFDEEEILGVTKQLSILRDELDENQGLGSTATGLSVRSTELVDQIVTLLENVGFDREKFHLAQSALNEHTSDLRYYFDTEFAGQQAVKHENGVTVEAVEKNKWRVSNSRASITLQGFDPLRHKIPEIRVKIHDGNPMPYREFEQMLMDIHPKFLSRLLRLSKVTEIINVD